jgi:hypothetical protein
MEFAAAARMRIGLLTGAPHSFERADQTLHGTRFGPPRHRGRQIQELLERPRSVVAHAAFQLHDIAAQKL